MPGPMVRRCRSLRPGAIVWGRVHNEGANLEAALSRLEVAGRLRGVKEAVARGIARCKINNLQLRIRAVDFPRAPGRAELVGV